MGIKYKARARAAYPGRGVDLGSPSRDPTKDLARPYAGFKCKY